jgi:type IV pilus assembly protein PilB
MDILKILVSQGIVSEQDASSIRSEVKTGTLSLENILEKKGISSEEILKQQSLFYDIPMRIIPTAPIGRATLEHIPLESAKYYGFVPIAITNEVLEVGITDPENIEALNALQFISTRVGIPYKIFLIRTSDFNKILEEYSSLGGEVNAALSELDPVLDVTEDIKESKISTVIKEDAPVTKIVATILRYAVEGGASDIHIEPLVEKTKVRFRMDGELHTSLELPATIHTAVVARIKILSQMRLDEKRKPQDGRFSAKVEDKRIDFRVSTFPTQYGEKVVMRILDRSKSLAALDTIGLTPRDLQTVKEILKKPYGIILVSGPTGSGKSTTLFGMLSSLDREGSNVVSVEDPVEYEVPGVSQSQVHPEIGYTFASGLRSILRQDPDVIMVGEIRDKETAQLAIQAALTGHLVLSTIHTNTAAGVIPRLVDMGVDPYLIAPTLIAAIGQRLVRKMCPGAEVEKPITESMRLSLEKDFTDIPEEFKKEIPPFTSFYDAIPTAECPNGTRGRLAVFEILRMDKDIEKVILTSPIEEKIYEAARTKGMFTMREDAIIKALSGQIPFPEINTLGGVLLNGDIPETLT